MGELCILISSVPITKYHHLWFNDNLSELLVVARMRVATQNMRTATGHVL